MHGVLLLAELDTTSPKHAPHIALGLIAATLAEDSAHAA